MGEQKSRDPKDTIFQELEHIQTHIQSIKHDLSENLCDLELISKSIELIQAKLKRL